MPIYEYRCNDCERRVSLFFPSFSAAESRATAGENRCPHCASHNLSRLMSRAFTARAESDATDAFDGSLPEAGGGSDDMLAGLDQEDPRSIARWVRQMKDSMGSDADFGSGFDQALSRIEAGEDPDKVMEDVDPDSLGDTGGDDFEDAGDF